MVVWRKFRKYEISNMGDVRNGKGLVLKRLYRGGYPCVNLYGCPDANFGRWDGYPPASPRGRPKHYMIAHLVLSVFRRPRPTRASDGTGKVVYKDGDRNNCKLDNLAWG